MAVHVETSSDDHALECETVDVSFGGTRLRSPAPLPVGRTVLVFMDLHDEPPLVVRGKVLEESLDMSTGFVEARIHFVDVRDHAAAQLTDVLETIDLRE